MFFWPRSMRGSRRRTSNLCRCVTAAWGQLAVTPGTKPWISLGAILRARFSSRRPTQSRSTCCRRTVTSFFGWWPEVVSHKSENHFRRKDLAGKVAVGVGDGVAGTWVRIVARGDEVVGGGVGGCVVAWWWVVVWMDARAVWVGGVMGNEVRRWGVGWAGVADEWWGG